MKSGERSGWSRRTILLAFVTLAVAVALSVDQGIHQHVGQDFHVFWQAGRNFASGDPLYHDYLPGARQFKYPPFAALVFQLLAVFPLPVAAVVFSLFNLLLWVPAVYLTREIVAETLPGRRPGVLSIVLAVVFSAQFLLDNFHHVQMNEVVFVLVLLGLYAYLRGKDVAAAACIVAATAIKVTPIFFAFWLVVRGRRLAALAVPPLALACLLLPVLVRGPSTGASELVEYYHSFLEGHQHGEVSEYTAGQNLAALVNRMMRPQEGTAHPSYMLIPAPEPTAQRVYGILWAAVLLAFAGKLVLLRLRRAPLTALEISMTVLAGLLLSPITFTTHLVSLLFVFHTFLSMRWAETSPRGRAGLALAWVAIAVIGLSGRDLAGNRLHDYVLGYSVNAWTMLMLFLGTVVIAGRPLRRDYRLNRMDGAA